MSIDYFDDLEDFGFGELAEDPLEARAEILETLEDASIEVEATDAEELDGDELAEAPGHVLFGFLHDRDLTLFLYAIPEDQLSKELLAAMETADGKSYARQELVQDNALAKAGLRLDAAFGIGLAVPSLKDAFEAIDAGDKDVLDGYEVAKIENDHDPEISDGAFDQRFIAAYCVRRGS